MNPEVKKRRIIGAGLPRTGTTSLTAALEILEYGPVLHAHHDHEIEAYDRLLTAKRQHPDINILQLEKMANASLQAMTAPYNATFDPPTADFYEDLLTLYPDSLVILTVRDSDEQWWSSFYGTYGFQYAPGWRGIFHRIILLANQRFRPRSRMMMSYVLLWQSKYGPCSPSTHTRRNEEVITRVPSDRLLVYNIKEGWGPLCGFLGVDVPAEPFPRLNDTAKFRAMVMRNYMLCVRRWAMGVASLFAAVGTLTWLL